MKLCVFAPVSYILPSRLPRYEDLYDTEVKGGTGRFRQLDRERSLQALMTVNLLKRLVSSVESFRLTLQRLANKHLATLAKIDSQKKTGRDATFTDDTSQLENAEPEEDDLDVTGEAEGEEIGGKIQIRLSDMDLPAWEHDLRADLALIEGLYGEMQKIAPSDDAKLQHLKTQILSKLGSPINPGNRKILIFTAFADTANYLYEHLAGPLLAHQRLHTGRVTGTDAPKSTLGRGYDFQSLLTLFSPVSKEKATILPEEPGEIDVLIGTDCISEGQNLQDCDYLINFVLHSLDPGFNIIQRFGRIDRIGSHNTCIQLVNYWPDITLDEYINLKERVENRMVIADVTATGDDNVLNSKTNDLSYRKEQLRRLQEEVIEMEDLKTGVSITDLGLNDFRMDLLNYLKSNGDLAGVPTGMHAVVPADPERGLPPGVIFALRNRNQSVNVNQQNRLHPYYLIYIAGGCSPKEQPSVIVTQAEVKQVLDLVRSACKGRSDPIPEVYRPFNHATQDGREMKAYSELLAKAIRSMVDLKEEKDIDSLFTSSKTSALISPIAGIDDFELIAFLVVQAVA